MTRTGGAVPPPSMTAGWRGERDMEHRGDRDG
jgi:hypothetical protein